MVWETLIGAVAPTLIGSLFGGDDSGGGGFFQPGPFMQGAQIPDNLKKPLRQALNRTNRIGQRHARRAFRPEPWTNRQRQAMSDISRLARRAELPFTAADYANQRLGMSPQEVGAFVNEISNPYIEQFAPQANSAAALAGRSGSGMAANMMGEGISRITNQNYLNFEGQRQNLAGMSPALEAARYVPAQQLFGVGQLQQQRKQQAKMTPLLAEQWRNQNVLGMAPGQMYAGFAPQFSQPGQFSGFQQAMGMQDMLSNVDFGGLFPGSSPTSYPYTPQPQPPTYAGGVPHWRR